MPRIAVRAPRRRPRLACCSRSATSTRRAAPNSGAWSAATSRTARTSSRRAYRELARGDRRPSSTPGTCGCGGDEFEYSDEPPRSTTGCTLGRDRPDRRRHRAAARAGRSCFVDPARRPALDLAESLRRTSCRGSWPPTSTADADVGSLRHDDASSTVVPGPRPRAPRTSSSTPTGCVYTGTEDGAIFRVRPDGGRIDRVGDTGGRPLGLELLPDGRLLVCDAHRGLLALDTAHRRVEALVTEVDGRRMVFCNNAAVAARRRHLVHRLAHASTRSSSGRPTSSRTPAPAGCCAARRTARSRCVLDGLRVRQRRRARRRRVVRRRRRDRRAGPSYATG